ncbi:MAG: hypothetical protein DI534_08380 [Leifsonia xyli]|nr:MAG: hypothetical protein DI534_08380 [Leifsonia xyli]
MTLPQEPGQGAPAATNPLAVAAFAAGITTVAIGVIGQFAAIPILRGGDYDLYSIVSVIFTVLSLLVALAALAMGLVAMQRPLGRLRAGIGVGIGGSAVVSIVLGFIARALMSIS